MSFFDSILDASIVFSFGRSGYVRHGRHFVSSDLDVDLSALTFVVTGANSGIGFETALGLAALGARVVMICRNSERGDDARRRIEKATGNANVDLQIADLSDHEAVRHVAKTLPSAIHGLVHNAGNMVHEVIETPQGIELITALHLSGPYLLTQLLVPALSAGASATRSRVVFVSSGGMYGARLTPSELASPKKPYDGVAHYAQTKRGQVVLASHLHQTLKTAGIAVHSMHPGWVDTPALRRAMPTFWKLMRWTLRTPQEGADTVLWLMAASRQDLDTEDGFWLDRKRVSTHLRNGTRHPKDVEKTFVGQMNEFIRR